MAVHVVGSINLDIIANVWHLPAPGATVLASSTARMAGGKGANQAVAAARMGADSRMLGAVGDDDAGKWMMRELAAFGVNLEGVRVLPGEETGTAYIAVDAQGENQIVVVSGANAGLTAPEPLRDGVLLSQLEVPLTVLEPVFARSSAIRILNAAPALTDARSLLDHVDILIVNQTELATLLDIPASPQGPREALAARKLLCRSGQTVIVTLGAGGAVAVSTDHALHAPAFPVVPLDTIGAGDCFCGALAALLDEGMPLETALPIANAAAALCTQKAGAAAAMPSRSEVDALLASDPATEHALAIKTV